MMSATLSWLSGRSRSSCSVAARTAAWARVIGSATAGGADPARVCAATDTGPRVMQMVHTWSMRRTLFEPEHADFRESVRRFVAEEVTPHQQQWEADGVVPRELFAKAAAKGMLAMQVPEQ